MLPLTLLLSVFRIACTHTPPPLLLLLLLLLLCFPTSRMHASSIVSQPLRNLNPNVIKTPSPPSPPPASHQKHPHTTSAIPTTAPAPDTPPISSITTIFGHFKKLPSQRPPCVFPHTLKTPWKHLGTPWKLASPATARCRRTMSIHCSVLLPCLVVPLGVVDADCGFIARSICPVSQCISPGISCISRIMPCSPRHCSRRIRCCRRRLRHTAPWDAMHNAAPSCPSVCVRGGLGVDACRKCGCHACVRARARSACGVRACVCGGRSAK